MFTPWLCVTLATYVAALTLPIPTLPPSNVSQYLLGDLASFSIEFAFFPEFIGNTSNPNTLTAALLGHITQRTRVPPSFRPGGDTADSSIYNASASAPAVTTIDTPSGGIYRTIYGSHYFQSMSVLHPDTQFIFDLNFANNSLAIAQNESTAAFAQINPSQLYAFELGNEPDLYGRAYRNASTWNALTYTEQWVNWTTAIQSSLGIAGPSFVALGVADNPYPNGPITTVKCVQDGIAKGGTVKAVSQHMYPYTTCSLSRAAAVTLPSLVNHASIVSYIDGYQPQVAAAQSINATFIIGEFNSVSCSGKANVTDTFGQALWTVDTILYGASLNISKFFFHQGATLLLQAPYQLNSAGFSHYNAWFPVYSAATGQPHAAPSYLAFLLIAEAVGSSGLSRLASIPTPGNMSQSLAVYAIWDDGVQNASEGPARLVLLNMGIYNSTNQAPRPSVSVDVSSLVGGGSISVQLKRMTAPGADEKNATLATWAGQQYYNGTAVGEEVIETAQSGNVTVDASEGVLVFLNGTSNGSTNGASPSAPSPSGPSSSGSSPNDPSPTGSASHGLQAYELRHLRWNRHNTAAAAVVGFMLI